MEFDKKEDPEKSLSYRDKHELRDDRQAGSDSPLFDRNADLLYIRLQEILEAKRAQRKEGENE